MSYAIHLAETDPPNTPTIGGTVAIALPLDSFSNVRLEFLLQGGKAEKWGEGLRMACTTW